MSVTFTLHDLLSFVLFLAGIAALVALFMVLLKVAKILGKVNDLIEKNQGEIDHTIKTIPALVDNAKDISGNVNIISADATHLVQEVKPEIEKVMGAVGSVSDTVNGITRRVDDTTERVACSVNYVSDTVSDAAKTITLNADNAMDYFYIVREVVAALKDVFLR
ncbi:MAG: hypothetical protein Q4P25_02695 [Tissierellia bacterium]|nr:hypothetical protein [Tissierellia bacterium]